MVTQEQLLNGILKYIDAEVMPVLPTSGKWIAGTAITLGSMKYQELITKFSTHPIVKGLELVRPDGTVDAEKVLDALKTSADKYGVLELTLPIIGTLRFTSDDVNKLKRYVVGDNYDRRIKNDVDGIVVG